MMSYPKLSKGDCKLEAVCINLHLMLQLHYELHFLVKLNPMSHTYEVSKFGPNTTNSFRCETRTSAEFQIKMKSSGLS